MRKKEVFIILLIGTQTSPAALSSDHLIKQLQDLLSEAKQLVEHQSSLTKEIAQGQLSPVQASPLKQEYEETDCKHINIITIIKLLISCSLCT